MSDPGGGTGTGTAPDSILDDLDSSTTETTSSSEEEDEEENDNNSDSTKSDTITDQLLCKWKCPCCRDDTGMQVIMQKDYGQQQCRMEYGMDDIGVSTSHHSPFSTHQSPDVVRESDSEVDTSEIPPDTLREKIWVCVEVTDCMVEPYATFAKTFVLLGQLFIVVSVVVFLIETYPQYHLDPPHELWAIETACIAFFTFELVLRAGSSPCKLEYFRESFTIIDILSILPYYINLIGVGDPGGLFVIRVLRLMRIFRVFRFSKYNEALSVVFGSLKKSTEGLYLLLFLILLSTVVFASAMYFAEREFSVYNATEELWYRGDEKSPFQSILHTFWWALVTLTTVGYGDDVPTSAAGKGVAAATMLCGTLVIAFPMVIIGQNFQELHGQRLRKERSKKTTTDPPTGSPGVSSPGSYRTRRDCDYSPREIAQPRPKISESGDDSNNNNNSNGSLAIQGLEFRLLQLEKTLQKFEQLQQC